MRICASFVGALLLAISVQARIPQQAGRCQHPEAYTPPDPATILVRPLVVRRVYGRAIVEAKDDIIPVEDVGGACLSLFTEETHRFVAATSTDKHGHFVFPIVQPGRYRLVSRSRGFCTGNTRIEVVTSTKGTRNSGILVHIRIHEVDGCSYAGYDTEDSAGGAEPRVVCQNAETVYTAVNRPRRGQRPRLAKAVLRHEYLEREEATGKTGLHAQ